MYQPGKPKYAGRTKGAVNKFTTLKIAFLQVFDKLGGVEGMAKWANESSKNKAVFYQMIAKMLPREVSLTGTPIEDLQKIKVEIVNGNNKS